MKTLTDYLEGPVPFFHEFFDAAKNTLHEDFPAPGTVAIEREESLLHSDEDGEKKKKNTFDLVFESEAAGKLTKAELRNKFRLKDDSVFMHVSLSKNGGGPFGFGATPALQFVCTKSNQAVTVNCEQLVYQFTNPTFAVHARSNFTEGGLPVHASVSACVCPRTFAGFCLDYDALRSGLRSSVAAFQHTSADGNCIWTASLDGRWNPGVTVSHCVNDKIRVLANVLPWGNDADKSIVAGIEYLAHNNHTLLLRGDWFNKMVSLGAAFDWAGWRIGASANWICPAGCCEAGAEKCPITTVLKPQFGFSFKA